MTTADWTDSELLLFTGEEGNEKISRFVEFSVQLNQFQKVDDKMFLTQSQSLLLLSQY